MLHTEPSFSIYADEDGFLENEKGDLGIKSSEGMDGCEFTFAKRSTGLIVEDDEDDKLSGFKNLGTEEKNMKDNEQIEQPSPKMYLATGFGIDGMGGIELKPTTFDEGGDVEGYYKMVVSEDPCNPLFLRNYGQLLQSKGDLTGAEDYYFRATVEDPKDGEILTQYAKLVWELHRDQDRALSYFERAAHAAPGDCNILAAYASFLWNIDEVQDKDSDHGGLILKTLEVEERRVNPPLHIATGLGANVAGLNSNIDYATERPGMNGNLEEYHTRTVDENPYNPSVLRNYARFLRQSKGDLQGAEEYYSRAMLADPGGVGTSL